MNTDNIIKEEFLHFIWKNNLFDSNHFQDSDGNKIEVFDLGKHNFDAGPDFFNAKIKIGNTVWAGNIEIHTKSSNWEIHKHHKDKAYDNVILQLVKENNKESFNTKGKKISTAVLNFNDNLIRKFQNLNASKQDIPCSDYISETDRFTLNAWLTNILIERFEKKTNYLKSILEFTKNNWEETFYIILASSFGFKINSEPFELLAKSLPLLTLSKNRDKRFTIEALLFGQSGMLWGDIPNDIYYNKLQKEFLFQKKKYNLTPGEDHLWKYLRIRPVNFPTIRISQFSDLIHKSTHIFSKILETKDLNSLYKLFDLKASEYWDTHYNFGKESKLKVKKIGKTAINTIIINTIIPILFLYGKEKDKEEIKTRAFNFLDNIKAEENHITKKWRSVGLEVKNAYFSQSYIHLFNEYCSKKRCLNCRIGMKFIADNYV